MFYRHNSQSTFSLRFTACEKFYILRICPETPVNRFSPKLFQGFISKSSQNKIAF